MSHARYLRLPSRHLGRSVHMWTYGWWGRPIVVFPSAAGMAHEWDHCGGIEALRPWIEAGQIKLYCPENNASETWTADHVSPQHRLARHAAYERFVVDELVPWIREDCNSPRIRMETAGVSLGAFYAANMCLKFPELFRHGLCLSGRYDAARFLDGYFDEEAYFHAPFSYVPNLHGTALARVRAHTALTLVVGRGAFENSCIPETLHLADVLAERGIPHHRDVWGHDSAHQWTWWARQLRHHIGARHS